MTGELSLTIQAGSQFSDIFKVMREDGIFCPTKLLFQSEREQRLKIIKLAEANIRNFHDIGISKDCLNRTQEQ